MTYLVACLSSGKGSWTHLMNIINSGMFEHTILITNEFGSQNFKGNDNMSLCVVDFRKDLPTLIKDIVQQIDGKVPDLEVGLNIISGTGHEHMAILAALIKCGLAIRLIDYTENGVQEI
ncbi:MAG: hypothetical protein V1725_00075 [archaeon]